MQIDKKTIRNVFFLAAGCIFLYWILNRTDQVRALWSTVFGVLSPFAIGAALAFVLNVPMRTIERNLAFVKQDGLRRTLAIVATLLVIVLLLVGVFWLLVPQITETVQALIPKITDFFLGLEVMVRGFLEDNPQVMQWVSSQTGFERLDWPALIQKGMTMLTNSVSAIASGAFSAVGSITDGIVDAVIAFVFSLYCLAQKETLARQGRKILYALCPEHFADESIRVGRLTNATFSNFISGQCLEAVILGCMFAVSMAIFKMPYIPLVSVLIAVTALIPLVGAFVGCVLSTFFILVNDPLQAAAFVVMFLVLQQIEGNLIYPKVVGTSIGLPGMWVLVAVDVGGAMMGVAGMLIMIPVSSVLYALAREFTTARVTERCIDPEKLRDHPPELKSKFKEKREKKKERILFGKKLDIQKKQSGKDNP